MGSCKSVSNVSGCLSFAHSYSLHCKQSYTLGQSSLFTGFACHEFEYEGKSVVLQGFPAPANTFIFCLPEKQAEYFMN